MAGIVKLYVWQGVLTDYTDGMIVVLAPDFETALATMRDHPEGIDTPLQDMGRVEPTVIDLADDVKPQAWLVWGGG